MLNGTLELHNIRDVEGFTDRIINRRRLHWLQPHEREDLHVYLIETCWELSVRFEPNGWPFSKWAGPTLNSRVTDWLRREFFDGRYVDAPTQIVPLDGLGEAEFGRQADFAADRSPDLVRVLGQRNSGGTRRDVGVGEQEAGGVERRVA